MTAALQQFIDRVIVPALLDRIAAAPSPAASAAPRGGAAGRRRECRLVGGACLLFLVALASPVAAQTIAPPLGMSRWAFWLAEAGQASDIVTTEIGMAKGLGERNHLMRARLIRLPVKLALPVVVRWAFKDAPRSTANAHALVLTAWGTSYASWNVYAAVKWGK